MVDAAAEHVYRWLHSSSSRCKMMKYGRMHQFIASHRPRRKVKLWLIMKLALTYWSRGHLSLYQCSTMTRYRQHSHHAAESIKGMSETLLCGTKYRGWWYLALESCADNLLCLRIQLGRRSSARGRHYTNVYTIIIESDRVGGWSAMVILDSSIV